MKKTIISIAWLGMVLLGLTQLVACGDDPNPELRLDSTSVNFEAGGGQKSVNITVSDTEWRAEVTQGSDWLSTNQNGNSLTITATENKTTNQRNGSVRVTATADANLTYTINVTQMGATGSILVNGQSSNSLTFEGLFNGESAIRYQQQVTVVSNVSWTASNVPDWISMSPTNGNGTVTISIYPKSENESASDRTATITLNGENGTSASIQITQYHGLSTAKVMPMNAVALYDQIAWELQKEGSPNKFQILCAVEAVYNRKTDNELLADLQTDEAEKYFDDYWMYFYSRDSYGNSIYPNTTYYICTVAYDENDKRGELVKTKVTTPAYANADDDAWVRISDIYYDMSAGFQFTATKEGYCDTYHVIYGNLPSSYTYPASAYVFEINYFLKYNRKHWYATNWELEIVTNYPNSHTFQHNVTDLAQYPLITICTWGVFKNGKTSSDAMLSRGNVSSQSRMSMAPIDQRPTENIVVRRPVEEQRAREFRNRN